MLRAGLHSSRAGLRSSGSSRHWSRFALAPARPALVPARPVARATGLAPRWPPLVPRWSRCACLLHDSVPWWLVRRSRAALVSAATPSVAAQSPARANSTGIRLLSTVPHLWSSSIDCPASSGKEKTKCDRIAPRTHSAGPVSQTCLLRLLRRELLRAFVTLDDSTPQRRISELRVWCLMNPLLCSRHHRQVTLAVKT